MLEAIALAVETHPDMIAAQENLRLARIDLGLAEREFNIFQVVVIATPIAVNYLLENQTPSGGLEAEIGFPWGMDLKLSYGYPDSYSAQLSQALFADPSLSSDAITLKQKQNDLEQTTLELAQAAVDVTMSTVEDFFSLLELEAAIQAMEKRVELSQARLKQVQGLAEENVAGPLDLLDAEIELQQSLQELLRNQENDSVKRAQLFSALGISTGTSLVGLVVQKDQLMEIADDLLDRPITSEIIENNLQVRQVRWNLEEALLQQRRTTQDRAPQFSLTLGYSTGDDGPGMAADGLEIGINITHALFDGGQGRLQEEKAKAQVQTLQRQLDETINTVELDLQSMRNALRTAKREVELMSLRLERMELEVSMMKHNLEAGLISDADWQDVQIRQLEMENSYRAALHDLVVEYLEYIGALGGALDVEVIFK